MHGSLAVFVDSLSWQSLTVSFEHAEFDVAVLGEWYSEWLDVAERRQPDAHGLSGVVHDLAWSSGPGDKWQLRLALGSAEVVALTDFLGILEHAGTRNCCLAQAAGEDASTKPKGESTHL